MKPLAMAGLVTLSLLASCGKQQQPPLGWDGVDGVPWGTPVEEARQRLAQPLEVDAAGGMDCGYTSVTVDGREIDVMVAGGRMVRADVTADSALMAPGGGHISSTAAEITGSSGDRVRSRPHKYTEGQYLIVSSPDDSLRRVVFEVEQDRVTRWRIGLFPEVEYVEGCS